MPIKLTIIERVGARNVEAPRKFYPSTIATSRRSQWKVATTAAKMSTLQPADMAAAVEIFLAVITDELSRDNIVDLGDFGTFWLKVSTEGAATAEEVSAIHIKCRNRASHPARLSKK